MCRVTPPMIQEKKLTPEVGQSSPILKGVSSMPPIHGYVLTSIKPEAEPILQTPLGTEEGEEEHDPVLVLRLLSICHVVSARILCRSMVLCERRPRRLFLCSPPPRRAGI